MVGWGVILLIFGIGSFLLPYMNYQFQLVQVFGEGNESIAGIALIVLGLTLIAVGFYRRRTYDV